MKTMLTPDQIRQAAKRKGWLVNEEYNNQIGVRISEWVWAWFDIYGSSGGDEWATCSHFYSMMTGKRDKNFKRRFRLEQKAKKCIAAL